MNYLTYSPSCCCQNADSIILPHFCFVTVQLLHMDIVHKKVDMPAQIAITVKHVEPELRIFFHRILHSLQRRDTGDFKMSFPICVVTNNAGNTNGRHVSILPNKRDFGIVPKPLIVYYKV